MSSVTLVTGAVFDLAGHQASGYADPVIRVLGDLPAEAEPFRIARSLRGPQGFYSENLLIVDGNNVVEYERGWKNIELRGEMFEDLFTTDVRSGVEIHGAGEHTLVILIDGREAGRLPVFIEANEDIRSSEGREQALTKALSKSAVVWLHLPTAPSKGRGKSKKAATTTLPAWYVAKGKQIYVISANEAGAGEQHFPRIGELDSLRCTIKSKDVKATIDDVDASVRVVDNDSDEFTEIANAGMGVRLNLPDGQDALERWRRECTMVELTLAI